MAMTDFRPGQQGYVLLAMLLVMFVSGTSFMLSAVDTRQTVALREQQELVRQLALAKEALLAYAANTSALYADAMGPGYLPCPDANDSGLPDVASGLESSTSGLCPSTTTLGRLPEYVPTPNGDFRINDYYADVDQQFWYAVSNLHLRTSTTTTSSNRTDSSLARLSLDGTGDIVALIIAPGDAFASQDRSSNQTLYSNYLDSGNGQSSAYVSSGNPDSFNDQIIAITHDELMQFVGASMASRIREELSSYYQTNGGYPWGNSFGNNYYAQEDFFTEISNDWLGTEGWNQNQNAGWGYRRSQRTYYQSSLSSTFSFHMHGCSGMRFQMTASGTFTRTGSNC